VGPDSLAVGRHVSEGAEQEDSLQVRVKGRGYDDVPPLRQLNAYKHRPRVDVDAPANLLLGDVHTVGSVELHLNTERAHRL